MLLNCPLLIREKVRVFKKSMPAHNSLRSVPTMRWLRIVPPTVIIYMITYMERMNISFAMAGGMNRALDLSMSTSGLAAGIFFVGYMLLQVPAGHIAEHGSAKRYILWSVVAVGSLSVITGFVQNAWQLLAMRFLLGVAEGGVYPAILIIISKWFPAKEIGRANALFLMSLPLSLVVSNPVSGWIVANHGWRWLFIIEGVAALAVIVVCVPTISDRPEDAKWISKEEKEYLLEVLRAEKAERQVALEEKRGAGAKASYKRLATDTNLWLMVALYICYTTGQYGYALWLPTFVKNLTKVNLTQVGWLSSLPFVVALPGLYLFGALSDKTGNRRLCVALSLAGFSVSFGTAMLFPGYIWFSYFLLVLTGLFTKSAQSPFWAIPDLVFPPGVSGGARGIINAVGNLGGLFGPALTGWFMTTTGGMKLGIYSLAFILLIGSAITMFLPAVTAGKIVDPTA